MRISIVYTPIDSCWNALLKIFWLRFDQTKHSVSKRHDSAGFSWICVEPVGAIVTESKGELSSTRRAIERCQVETWKSARQRHFWPQQRCSVQSKILQLATCFVGTNAVNSKTVHRSRCNETTIGSEATDLSFVRQWNWRRGRRVRWKWRRCSVTIFKFSEAVAQRRVSRSSNVCRINRIERIGVEFVWIKVDRAMCSLPSITGPVWMRWLCCCSDPMFPRIALMRPSHVVVPLPHSSRTLPDAGSWFFFVCDAEFPLGWKLFMAICISNGSFASPTATGFFFFLPSSTESIEKLFHFQAADLFIHLTWKFAY